jgi:hypothetical protein
MWDGFFAAKNEVAFAGMVSRKPGSWKAGKTPQ